MAEIVMTCFSCLFYSENEEGAGSCCYGPIVVEGKTRETFCANHPSIACTPKQELAQRGEQRALTVMKLEEEEAQK